MRLLFSIDVGPIFQSAVDKVYWCIGVGVMRHFLQNVDSKDGEMTCQIEHYVALHRYL